MTNYNIVVLPGDGVGPEVTAEAVKVLETLQKVKSDMKFDFKYAHIGGIAIDETGNPLPDETVEACKAADGILLGAVGGPKWGTGKVRPEQGLLRIRKELNFYANIRPCNFASESLIEYSPLKEHVCKGTDITMIRELVGGVYFGDRKEDDGSGFALDTMPYSREEIERVTRLAGSLAMLTTPPQPVHCIDKANVLATSRLWRTVVSDIMSKEFPDVDLKFQLVDSAAMLLCKNPRALNGVMLTENLFGDILSDEASVIPGSLGLLPSASLNATPDGKSRVNGLYEPIHGSAPDIAGQGIVNPIATILSVALLLRWSLGLEAEAKAIEDAVRKVLDSEKIGGQGLRTKDLGGDATTSQIGDAVCKVLESTLA
ncbi:3-isopropylmalate dehydrogenase [Saitoella coloradoensis]